MSRFLKMLAVPETLVQLWSLVPAQTPAIVAQMDFLRSEWPRSPI